MRLYVFNANKLGRLLVMLTGIVCLLLAAGVLFENTSAAFAGERKIPIYSVDCTDKKASITFDCAWGSEDIPGILETLKKENVKATFFIVGLWAEKYPDMVRMISRDGHDIANHSYSHLRMGDIGREKIRSEISLCSSKLEEISGNKVELFRAPFGYYNDNVVSIASEMGCHTIQWDVDSLDWRPGISQDEILSRIDAKVKNGSIILFHNDTPHTAKILPSVISRLKNSGYELLPVSKIILRSDYYIDFKGRQVKADR